MFLSRACAATRPAATIAITMEAFLLGRAVGAVRALALGRAEEVAGARLEVRAAAGGGVRREAVVAEVEATVGAA